MTSNTSNEISASTVAGVYAKANIENAPPLKIVRLLYQGAIRFLDNAAACEPTKPDSKFAYWLGRADDIVVELRLGLESAPAPEIAASLTDLYLFVETAVGRARAERSVEPLSGARAVLARLLEAWTAIDTGKV